MLYVPHTLTALDFSLYLLHVLYYLLLRSGTMRFSNLASFAATLFLGQVLGLSDAEWRSQSIYQIMTDRFATGTGDRSACSDLGEYCGGTWQGIIDQLDYIQGMGFTAVSLIVLNRVPGRTNNDRSGSHQSWRT